MRLEIETGLETVNSLDTIYSRMVDLFSRVQVERGAGQIGYVSGIINSDGPEHVARNVLKLAAYTETIRSAHDFPIFSATDIFTPTVREALPEMQLQYTDREELFYDFWRKVLCCGYVTDIFMTPRWPLSKGAVDEFLTAQRAKLRIWTVEEKGTVAPLDPQTTTIPLHR
jgi:hypothetical protein